MAHREDIVTPVGRLVQGSLYVPNTKDAEGKALIFKTGDKAGQPRTDFYVAIAIPKNTETHWAQTEWGAKIWSVGHKGFPNGQANSPSFAWKIIDGDSLIPNKKGTVPASCEGFAGCWVLKFNGSQAPSIVTLTDQNKTQPLLEKDAIKPGDYIQIQGSVSDNESQQQPGVYLNHNFVCFRHIGQRIFLGVDPDSIGFGQAPLPASSASVVNGVPVSAPIPAPTAPTTQAYMAPPSSVSAPIAAPAPVAAPAPYANILTPPLPSAPSVAPAAAPARVMTSKAQGTYEAYIAQGWTDVLLIQHGMMQA